ncbi:MAG: pantoate--beta-alanine ligase [Candidatus Omnitrophica bacterium]|nr:pantoate--beta-alanine ligase [Candidatus Omnitrophota bacterium]
MQIVRGIKPLRRLIRRAKKQGKTIGFVPTMGALHEGHLSLIRAAKVGNDLVAVSIFVNPIQFNRKTDLAAYPRPLRQDIRLCKKSGVDFLFIPSVKTMYPAGFQTICEVLELSRPWEGFFRPGHFRGVTTVVAKLLNLVQPDTAYFGEKDFQQAAIIRRMVRDLNVDVRIKVLPTIREKDGLAMSSRNRLLPSELRRPSRTLFLALQEGRRLIESGERRRSVVERRMRSMIRTIPRSRLEYCVLVDPAGLRRVPSIKGEVVALLAVWVGSTRLIDAMRIRPRRTTRMR